MHVGEIYWETIPKAHRAIIRYLENREDLVYLICEAQSYEAGVWNNTGKYLIDIDGHDMAQDIEVFDNDADGANAWPGDFLIAINKAIEAGFRPMTEAEIRREENEERRERAMEAGMAYGCAGYNDFMGWGDSEDEGYWD